MGMFGVGPVLGPQLMAEIGDVRRFEHKRSLVAFAGVDAPPCQSGAFESKNRHISKRGSPRLRKTLFQVMSTIIQHAPADDPVFQFLDRKRREGKHYYLINADFHSTPHDRRNMTVCFAMPVFMESFFSDFCDFRS